MADDDVATLKRLVQGLVKDRDTLVAALTAIVQKSQEYEMQPRDRMIWIGERGVKAIADLTVPVCFAPKDANG